MGIVFEINNPFELFKDSVTTLVEEEMSILDWLKANRSPEWQAFDKPTLCLFNGEAVFQKDYGTTKIKDKDVVNFIVLSGDPVTIIIAVVVAVVAVAAALIFAPQPPNVGDTPEPNPTFTLRGQGNTNKLGQVIPSHYGRVKNWFDVAAKSYNQYIGNDQYQFSLYSAGHGDYDFEPFHIEDTPVDNFRDVTIEVYPPGERVTLFPDNVITSVEVGSIELFGPNEEDYEGDSGPFIANENETVATKIQVDIVLSKGLYFSNDDGGLTTRTVTAIFEYQQIDDDGVAVGPWLTLTSFSKTLATTTPQRFTVEQDVPEGRYQVRARRTNDKDESHRSGNDLVWEAMRAFLPNTQEYGDVTIIARRALATNNLNDNSSSRLNAYQTRKLEQYDDTTGMWSARLPTRNPVWAAIDVFKAKYGGQLTDRFIDLVGLSVLRQVYDDRQDNFDWTFDNKTNVWSAAKLIFSVGRAIPMLNGSQVTAVRDEPKTLPTGVFTPDNIIQGSFSWDLSMFKLNDEDGIELEYLDEDTWAPETVLCLIGNDTGLNPKKVKLNGVINRNKAYREGLHLRSKTLFQREVIKFKTGLEGHIPFVDSLISIVHDVPRWGNSGFVVSRENDILALADEVTFDGSSVHQILLRKRDGSGSGPFVVEPFDERLTTTKVRVLEAFDDIIERPSTEEFMYFQFGVQGLYSKLARVRSIRPAGEGEITIEAVNNDDRIYSFDEQNAPAKDLVGIPPGVPDLPVVTRLSVLSVPNVINRVQVAWAPAPGARSYVVEISYDNETFTQVATTLMTYLVIDVVIGTAFIRVAAVNVDLGPYVTWTGTVGHATNPPNNVTGLTLQSPFVGVSAKIQWNPVGTATSYVVQTIRASDDSVLRETEVLNTTFTYSNDQAATDFAGNPERTLKFSVKAKNSIGESDVAQVLTANNPTPTVVAKTAFSITNETTESWEIQVSWTALQDSDIKEYRIWASATQGFSEGPTNLVARGLFNMATFTVSKTGSPTDYYVRIAALDYWGDNYNLTAELSVDLT